MTSDEAIARARMIAEEEGWTWREPARASLEAVGDADETLFSDSIRRLSRALGRASNTRGGRRVWQVLSNAGSRGLNVVVTIDDVTGEVLHKAFWPR